MKAPFRLSHAGTDSDLKELYRRLQVCSHYEFGSSGEGELTIRAAGRTAYARKYRAGDGWGISIMQGPERIGRAKPSNLDEAVAFIESSLEMDNRLDLQSDLAMDTVSARDCYNTGSADSANVGYVYVLVNPSIPDQVKVGFTSRTPQERCAEISQGTGIPTPFKVAFQERFLDAQQAEREVHAIMERQGMRTSGSREFFIATVDEAATVIRAVKKRLYGRS